MEHLILVEDHYETETGYTLAKLDNEGINHVVGKNIWLGRYDSIENYNVITDEQAEEIREAKVLQDLA